MEYFTEEQITQEKNNKYQWISENGLKVLMDRWMMRVHGNPILKRESIHGMFHRVCTCISGAITDPQERTASYTAFMDITEKGYFLPNSPTFTGAGTKLGQLAACYVLPIVDDLGKEESGIFDTLKNAALIQQGGGGIGFSFSRLREEGQIIATSGGSSTGPVGFMKVYDKAFGMIAQGGTRRGANMAVLRVDHPDIKKFIVCKTSEGEISNFNVSVGITDDFMKAVRAKTSFDLVSPMSGDVVETIDATALMDLIVKQAHKNGEPGLLFLDTANADNPTPDLYTLESTNPCGEQWLGPFENCCLGSIDISKFDLLSQEGWEELRKTTETATLFLDCVVTANIYVPSIHQLRKSALTSRRIGLGFMGLADTLIQQKLRYGSQAAAAATSKITEFIRFHSMKTSCALAKKLGPFPAVKESIYGEKRLAGTRQKILEKAQNSLNQKLDWGGLFDDIKLHGIRNACQTTIAPTGSIASVAGCFGYGCEPIFALSFTRFMEDNSSLATEKRKEMYWSYQPFSDAIKKDEEILQLVRERGSCQGIPQIETWIRDTFVVSSDVTPAEHILMQSSVQKWIDNSIAKTCNLPEDATEENVQHCYFDAWTKKCKGITVYVKGSRKKEVLKITHSAEKEPQPLTDIRVKLPKARKSITIERDTPAGKIFVHMSKTQDGAPAEVFCNHGKTGSDGAAICEAFGRLISMILRFDRLPPRTERMILIRDQLTGIGGGSRPVGIGPTQILSLPDGIGHLLNDCINVMKEDASNEAKKELPLDGNTTEHQPLKRKASWDICPECSNATFVRMAGCCKKCMYTRCAYEEC